MEILLLLHAAEQHDLLEALKGFHRFSVEIADCLLGWLLLTCAAPATGSCHGGCLRATVVEMSP